MTKHFSKWVSKQKIPSGELLKALSFAKNDKSNLNPKELTAFKEIAKVILSLSISELNIAIKSGSFIEVEL